MHGSDVLCLKCDVTNEMDLNNSVRKGVEKYGFSVHGLVSNHASFVFKSIEHASLEEWTHSLKVNVTGTALLTKAFLPGLKKAGNASIVFLGSISGFLAQPNCATYAITKAAIGQLARSSAYDLAKYGTQITPSSSRPSFPSI